MQALLMMRPFIFFIFTLLVEMSSVDGFTSGRGEDDWLLGWAAGSENSNPPSSCCLPLFNPNPNPNPPGLPRLSSRARVSMEGEGERSSELDFARPVDDSSRYREKMLEFIFQSVNEVKAGVKELRGEVKELRVELKGEIRELRVELKGGAEGVGSGAKG